MAPVRLTWLRRSVLLTLLLQAGPALAREAGEVQEEITLLPANPTTVNDLARQHYEEAVNLYRQNKYRLARVEFQVSYDLCRAPELLHNLSVTAEHQYLLDDAISFEEQYLATKPELTPTERQQTDVRLATLRRNRAAAGIASKQPSDKSENAGVKHYGPAIGLMAGGGALLLVGIGSGAGALVTQRTVDAGGLVMADYQSLVGRGNALNASAIAFDCVGGAMLASGLVLALVTRFR